MADVIRVDAAIEVAVSVDFNRVFLDFDVCDTIQREVENTEDKSSFRIFSRNFNFRAQLFFSEVSVTDPVVDQTIGMNRGEYFLLSLETPPIK